MPPSSLGVKSTWSRLCSFSPIRGEATLCTAWAALGRVSYDLAPSERGNLQFRRSLYVVADMAAGEEFTAANLRSIRPGYGMAPKHLPDILGRRTVRAVARGTPLSWDLVAPR